MIWINIDCYMTQDKALLSFIASEYLPLNIIGLQVHNLCADKSADMYPHHVSQVPLFCKRIAEPCKEDRVISTYKQSQNLTLFS